MATIKFRLRKGKSDPAKISVYVSMGRGALLERKTGLTIPASAWSKSAGYPKQNHASHKNTAKQLRELETHLYNQLNDTKETINGTWLENEIGIFFGRKSRSGYSESVLHWFDEVLLNAHLRKSSRGGIGLSKSRIQQYTQTKNLFAEFQKGKAYKVRDVNKKLGENFMDFLMNKKGYGEAYTMKNIENLKSVCYEAETNGIEISPQLRRIDSAKPKTDSIIFLKPEELHRIAEANISKAHLQNARKWLLFGCWIGQRGSDLINITEKNIKERSGNKYLEITQKKGNKKVTVRLLSHALDIIKDGLPHKIALQNLNNYMKEVCRIAEIDQPTEGSLMNSDTKRKEIGTYPKYELIASHVCRRSFASNLYGKVPTPVIMQATGHATEKTLLAYIGKSGADYDEFWDKLEEQYR